MGLTIEKVNENLEEENVYLNAVIGNDKKFIDDETINCIEQSLRRIKYLRNCKKELKNKSKIKLG